MMPRDAETIGNLCNVDDFAGPDAEANQHAQGIIGVDR
jgi:hypothetical protein